jgi:uncharacterized protein
MPDLKLAQQIAQTIADEIGAQAAQARAAIALLDGGATVPFIARYRKEITGGLDDAQLRNPGRAPDATCASWRSAARP